MVRQVLLLLVFSSLFLTGWSQADFVENRGQWPSQVTARAELPAGALWVESGALTWQFFDPRVLGWLHPVDGIVTTDSIYREHTYRVNFEGSQAPIPVHKKSKSYYHNYYLGEDPTKWVSGAGVFGETYLFDLYENIDLKIYSHAGNLKYDFIVHPGSDPTEIALQIEGADEVRLEQDELVISTSVNEVREKRPFAFQTISGRIIEVSCSYELVNGRVKFNLGRYNGNYDLIIDPEIAFSTYIGSSASNFGFTACDDSEENLISGAAVFALNYPVTPGAFQSNFSAATGNYMDVVISKFGPAGNELLYSTYLGGGKQETPHSIVTDSDDNIIIMGVTGSNDFPTTAGAYQTLFQGGPVLMMGTFFTSGHPDGCDFFIHKFSPAGALLRGTFAGTSTNDGLNYADQLFYNYGDAFRGEVNVDDSNNIFIASVVRGTFSLVLEEPQTNFGGGDSDGIVMKFDPQLNNIEWRSYIGGNGADACYAIEFDGDGNIILAGGTRSANFPHCINGQDISQNGQTDGFVVKINPVNFSVISGTFVGTAQYDQVYFIQTDDAQNIYVLGQTRGNMALSPGVFGQPNSGQFIRKYNSALTTVQWTTTIGTQSGQIDISPTAFLVSDCGQIYFSGWGGNTNSNSCGGVYSCYATASTTNGLPITPNAFQTTTDGSDFYLCVLSPDATNLVYGSFLGGSESAEHVDGGTSRFNKNGSVYQAVCAGCQGNSDFPTTPGAWSDTNPSFGCNLAVFRFNLGQVAAQLQIDGPSEVCEGQSAQFLNLSVGANQYEWDFGDGAGSAAFQPQHIYEQSGTFTITLIASDELECLVADTTSITITILPGVNPTVDEVEPFCLGQQVQLNAIGSTNLFWIEHPTLSDPTIPNPIALPEQTTTYYAVDFNDCESDTVGVTVTLFVPVTTISEAIEICLGESATLTASGGETYQWSPSEGLASTTGSSVTASPLSTTTYSVSIITEDGCQVIRTITVTVYTSAPGGLTYPTISMCVGNNAQLLAEDGFSWSWSPVASLSDAFIQNPMAFPSDTTTYSVQVTNVCGTGISQVTVNVIYPGVEVFGGGTICKGQYVEAWAIGAQDYYWNPPAFAHPANSAFTLLSPPETMAFTVAGIDEFGCGAQDSVWVFVLPLPPVNAGPDQYFDFPGSVYLFGNSFGLDYSWSPPNDLTCTDCAFPQASPEEETWYYLSVTDHNGCIGVDSVFVKPYFPIWVPNTITPNNDGINDYFQAYGVNIEGFHLQIFDRWGNLVFETTDPLQVWDGGIAGYYVQNDTYIWSIEYDTSDRRKRLVGHVNVIR